MPTDAMGDRQSALFDLIVLLRTLNLGYHHAHVNTKGRAYYGDHLLLQRLYTGNGGPNPITEIDGLMEQWKRLYPQSMLDPAAMAVAVAHAAQPLARKSGEAAMRALLEMERTLGRRIANVLKSWPGEDAGLDNFLQGIADQHGTNIYLLQQRLANGTAHIAPEPPVTAGPRGDFPQYSLEQLREALADLPDDAPRLREQIEAEIARRVTAAPVWIIRYRYVEPQPTGPFTGHMESPEPRKKGDIIPAMFGRARVTSSSRKRPPRVTTAQGYITVAGQHRSGKNTELGYRVESSLGADPKYGHVVFAGAPTAADRIAVAAALETFDPDELGLPGLEDMLAYRPDEGDWDEDDPWFAHYFDYIESTDKPPTEAITWRQFVARISRTSDSTNGNGSTGGPVPRYPEMVELAAKINAHLAAGGHVQVTTYTKSWLYGPKHAGWFGTDKSGNLTVQHGRGRHALSIAGRPSVGIRFSRLPTTSGPGGDDVPWGPHQTFSDDTPVPDIDDAVTAANARRLANTLIQHGPSRVENVITHFAGMYDKRELAAALRLLGQRAQANWPRLRLLDAVRAWAQGQEPSQPVRGYLPFSVGG